MAKNKDNEKSITVEQLRYLYSMERKKLIQLKRRKRATMQLMGENTTVKESLKELGKGNKETIIPIGAGVFVSGTVVAQSFKRTLPGNIVLPSTQEEVEKDLLARDKAYVSDITHLESEIVESQKNLGSMNALLKLNRQKGKKA